MLTKTHIIPTLAIEAMQLHLEVIEIHRSDAGQNLVLQCGTASLHDLLGDGMPTVLDQQLLVNVGTEELCVVSEECNDWMADIDKHLV